MTKYAVSSGQNCWSGGTQIIPLSGESARDWAEKHLDADDYEAIFGEVSEDESRVVITLSMSAAEVETAKRAAAQAGLTLSAYIGSLISQG